MSISLNYLSDNAQKLFLASIDELDSVSKVFERCCEIKSKHIISQIENNQLGKLQENQETETTLTKSSSKFIRSLSEQLILQFCSLSEQVNNKQQVSSTQISEKDERDKKRLAVYDSMIADFFTHISREMASQISTIVKTLQTILEGKADDQWDGVVEQYEKYVAFQNNLLSL